MYSTCIFCQKPLGSNQSIEHFPVGQRLAFDAARGRLWVVCRHCERWNLSPLETRWEAIEECEKSFRSTRLRVSTDNIGLARLVEGLELVRIGEPLRPEFAAWRYGDQFGRRRRRAILVGGGIAVALGAVVVGASAAGIGVGGLGGIWGQLPNIINGLRWVRVKTPDGRVLKVRGSALQGATLVGERGSSDPILSFKLRGQLESFHGEGALQLAGKLLPAINPAGGSKRAVVDAVQAIEQRAGPEAFLEQLLAGRVVPIHKVKRGTSRPIPISQLPTPTRLAIEMALHEEAERRAIQGELAVLEAAWQDAEEIAAIADDLLVPSEVQEQLDALKKRGTS